MNSEAFDAAVENTFGNYGPLGVDAQLLSVKDTCTALPPGDWVSVTVEVTPIVPEPHPLADTWHYGGITQKETGPVPLGTRAINRDRLITSSEAAERLPEGFPLAEASCDLYWPLVPGVDEPTYTFHHDEGVVSVGAYSGQLH